MRGRAWFTQAVTCPVPPRFPGGTSMPETDLPQPSLGPLRAAAETAELAQGLVYASSMVNLYAARHRLPVPALARWLLALGIVATLAANMAQGWSHGPVGAVIAAWPAVSLVGSYELLVWIIRTAAAGSLDREPAADHAGLYVDHPAHGRAGASLPEATPDNDLARVGLVPACGNGPQAQARGPGHGIVPDRADQDADQIRAGSGQAGTGR